MEAHPRPHGLMLASPGSRFAARMVDVVVVLVLAALANVWFAVEFWRAMQPVFSWAVAYGTNRDLPVPASAERANEMLIAMTVVLAAVWFAYEVPATSNSGQTLGKRLFGIRVVGLGPEEGLGFGQSFRRWFRLGWPTAFWAACFGLTALFQIFDCLFIVIDQRMHLALHDRVALTAVVQVPRAGRPETQRTAPPAGGPHADPR